MLALIDLFGLIDQINIFDLRYHDLKAEHQKIVKSPQSDLRDFKLNKLNESLNKLMKELISERQQENINRYMTYNDINLLHSDLEKLMPAYEQMSFTAFHCRASELNAFFSCEPKEILLTGSILNNWFKFCKTGSTKDADNNQYSILINNKLNLIFKVTAEDEVISVVVTNN